MENNQDYKIISSDEYKEYLAALCRLASGYVSRIRVQFAVKAYEKYADETLRRIVYAYGEECVKLDKERQKEFEYVSKYGPVTEDHLADSCLIHANEYGRTIYMLFDIV